ncbi:ABC transporter permease, partial [Clostridium sp.]|uniref:ABC transporter permease n=1 Tax=Clostridium sp. TaxID=1506 RepID=UPI0034638FE9
MNFNHIAIKNFKGNIKSYISYFICNTFSITIFFMYSTIFFNEDFYRSKDIEKGVMDAILIPTVALILFSVFFIIYSHSTFIKRRKREFGVFMSLGMGPLDIVKLILVENGVIAFISIAFGVLVGTIFSRLFFLFIVKLIDITSVSFSLSFKSYIFSIVVFSLIFSISILITLIQVNKFEIVKLLKSHRISEGNSKGKWWIGIVGCVFIILSMTILYIRFGKDANKDSELLLYCTVSLFIGIYLALHGLGGIILNLVRRSRNLYRNLLVVSNLNHKFKQVKNIMFVVILLIMITIWYSGHCLNLYLSSERIARESNPYDISFIETSDNKNIDEINNILNKEDNPITKYEKIEFLYCNKESETYDRNIE